MKINRSELKAAIKELISEVENEFYHGVRKDQLKWKKKEDPNAIQVDDTDKEKERYDALVNDIVNDEEVRLREAKSGGIGDTGGPLHTIQGLLGDARSVLEQLIHHEQDYKYLKKYIREITKIRDAIFDARRQS